MTVRELRELLKDCNEDKEVFIRISNSYYVDSIGSVREKTISPFWGDDDYYDAVVIFGREQVGSL